MKKLIYYCILSCLAVNLQAQSVLKTAEFSLASPFTEPDGRSDFTVLPNKDIVTLSKTKGNLTGSSEFILEKLSPDLDGIWQTELTANSSEDYKEIFFNGQHVIILSVIHLEKEKKTKLEAYGFNPSTGKKEWTKELESYEVQDWELHPHKGRVKESFIDVICEHVNPDFITPFEYKHNIKFSPDHSQFVSYVYNYGEQNLTATVSIYDRECKLKKRDKISIDNDFTNYGFYINNIGELFIVNANKFGQVNLIRYEPGTKDFELLQLPGSSLMKDDFTLQFTGNDVVYLANSEMAQEKIMGILVARFDFEKNTVDEYLHLFDGDFKAKVAKERKEFGKIRGEEDWKGYDITEFILAADNSSYIVLEKHMLYADGYPNIERDVFDKSHKKQIDGHVNAEGIIIVKLNPTGSLAWQNYIPKNQIYPALDGLNTISYSLNEDIKELRMIYAYGHSMDGVIHDIRYVTIDKETGLISKNTDLGNKEKLALVKDFTIWGDDEMIIVGKKGLLGKKSLIIKYKL